MKIGADWNFSDQWSASRDVRYIDIGTDAQLVADEGTLDLGTVDVDPILYSLMIGYRF